MYFSATNVADVAANALIQLTQIPNKSTADVVKNGKLRALKSKLFNGINKKCLT